MGCKTPIVTHLCWRSRWRITVSAALSSEKGAVTETPGVSLAKEGKHAWARYFPFLSKGAVWVLMHLTIFYVILKTTQETGNSSLIYLFIFYNYSALLVARTPMINEQRSWRGEDYIQSKDHCIPFDFTWIIMCWRRGEPWIFFFFSWHIFNTWVWMVPVLIHLTGDSSLNFSQKTCTEKTSNILLMIKHVWALGSGQSPFIRSS